MVVNAFKWLSMDSIYFAKLSWIQPNQNTGQQYVVNRLTLFFVHVRCSYRWNDILEYNKYEQTLFKVIFKTSHR
jgi:hypothetical protein